MHFGRLYKGLCGFQHVHKNRDALVREFKKFKQKVEANNFNNLALVQMESHTGAFCGKIAVVTDIKPFSTRVNASTSFSVGVPKCTVLVMSVVPSNNFKKLIN